MLTLQAVLIALVAIFELGSLVCATAPTSQALIVGRVISGIGATGITSGGFVTINMIVPLKSRPKYLGQYGDLALAISAKRIQGAWVPCLG